MLTLIIGGARSGKSRYAQSLGELAERVVYVATARSDTDDPEMRDRIERHRASRSAWWATVEEPLHVPEAVTSAEPSNALVIVDCVTIWLSNLMWEHRNLTADNLEIELVARVERLARAAIARDVVAVTNEVGEGLVPESPLGRRFRDLQGLANQLLARQAEGVVLMVAGIPVPVKIGADLRSFPSE